MRRASGSRRWQRIGGLTLAAAILASPGAVEARTGVLPVRGPAKLASELGAALLVGLRTRGGQPLGPAELQQRLEASPQVAAALKAARQEISQAEEGALYMKKQRASSAARRAVAQLAAIAARHYVPADVGRAHLARGIAALLEPTDLTEALVAFHAAFSVAPELEPDPDRVSSRTAKLLEQARRSAPAAQPPTSEELAMLAQLSGQDELLWITAAPRADQIEVVALRYDQQSKTLTGPHRVTGPLPGPEGWGAVADRVAGLLGVSPPTLPIRVARPAITPAPDVVPAERPSLARPWYRSWWVWTLAGSVVAGSAVAILVGTARTERSYGFRFELK